MKPIFANSMDRKYAISTIFAQSIYSWLLQNYNHRFRSTIEFSLGMERLGKRYKNRLILPVVSAGVHSCSPVAPHNNVNSFDGSTVTMGPAGECNADTFRLPTEREMFHFLYTTERNPTVPRTSNFLDAGQAGCTCIQICSAETLTQCIAIAEIQYAATVQNIGRACWQWHCLIVVLLYQHSCRPLREDVCPSATIRSQFYRYVRRCKWVDQRTTGTHYSCALIDCWMRLTLLFQHCHRFGYVGIVSHLQRDPLQNFHPFAKPIYSNSPDWPAHLCHNEYPDRTFFAELIV